MLQNTASHLVPEQPARNISDDAVLPKNASTTTNGTCSKRWTDTINCIRAPILTGLHFITHLAAANPKRTIVIVSLVSIALLMIGFATNFEMEGDEEILWTPEGSKADLHGQWIEDESGFPDVPRQFIMFFHNDGANVLEKGNNVAHIFAVLDAVRAIPDYDRVCANSTYVDPMTKVKGCKVWGVTKFWNNTAMGYEEDPNVLESMSEPLFPDGSFASEQDLFGYPSRNTDTGLLDFVQSYTVVIDFPDTELVETFEEEAIGVVLEFDASFLSNPEINLRAEISAFRSFEDE